MRDEATDLMNTLAFAVDVITTSEDTMLQRIGEVYAEARELVASIPLENGSARPRIVACFAQFNVYKAKDDMAGTGWLLMALQERIAQKDLSGWSQLEIVANKAAQLLPAVRGQVH